eukprot:14985_1
MSLLASPEEAPQSVCPVDHSRYTNEPPDTPMDHTISHFHSMAKVIKPQNSNDPHDIIPGLEIPATGRGNSDSGKQWLNPSANQLFRSLERKDKPIEHEDSLSVAAVHAIVTEQTWNSILQYEGLHSTQCDAPKLARFEGRDGFYSPKAKFFHYVMGMPWPYDRHDWTVDRCGKEVQYVIDYYALPVATDENVELINNMEETKESDVYAPFIQDKNIQFMYTIDARPKLNSFGNMVDRVKIAYRNWKNGQAWY